MHVQVFGNAMLFEKGEHAEAFKAACIRASTSLEGVVLLSVDGCFAYNLAGLGAEDAGNNAYT